MTNRAYDIVVAGVLMTVSVIIHLMAVNLFAPDQPLWNVATDGTSVLNGTQKAALWFEILSVWMPLLVFGTAMVYVMVREYRRQVQTATQARP